MATSSNVDSQPNHLSALDKFLGDAQTATSRDSDSKSQHLDKLDRAPTALRCAAGNSRHDALSTFKTNDSALKTTSMHEPSIIDFFSIIHVR